MSFFLRGGFSEANIARVLDVVEAMLRAGTCSIDYHRDIHEVPPTFSSLWKEYQTSPTLKLSIRGTLPADFKRSAPSSRFQTESCMGVAAPPDRSVLRVLPTLQEFVARYGPWTNDTNPERHGLTGATATHMIIDDPNAGVQKEGASVKVKKDKRRRFYVGKPGVMESAWANGTLQEAVDQATAIVEQTGEEQVVVQVVRVVRRKPQPIVVEAVK